MNAVDELIRLYAKQLKIPSFAEYQEVLRQADPSAGFADLLLELMKAETASRQENQKQAAAESGWISISENDGGIRLQPAQ